MQQKQQKQLKLYQNPFYSPRYYKGFTLGLFSFLVAYFVANIFTPVQQSDASTVRITNNTSDYYIEITSADALDLSVTADPNGKLAYAADTVKVVTNSDNGYKLYVSTSGNDNNIYQGGNSATASQGYFQPGTGTISSPAALGQNSWGFALNKSQNTSYSSAFANVAEYVNETGAPTTSSTWAAVPTFANSEQAKISEYSGDNSPAGTSLDIYYGINASTTLPTGNYTTEVTYTAFSEGVNEFPTMQDFTAEQCYNMAENTSINLSDARDDKYYRVTKLADGHCWMTDNLALDGTDKSGNVRVLTPADSNVTTNRTLAANIENGTTSAYDVIQIYSGVANDVTDSCDLTTNPYCIVNTSTKYGNLYNWNAATAGVGKQATTGTVTESICPKGWQLPDNSGIYSYSNLALHYGLPTSVDYAAGTAIQTIQRPPLYFAIAGTYVSTISNQGNHTYYWSRTDNSSNASIAFSFLFDTQSGNFSPQADFTTKNSGFPVRCVFIDQSSIIMQNFTATQCANLAESTTTVDNRITMIDSRDSESYTVSKLADGNCWMVQNLRYNGGTSVANQSGYDGRLYQWDSNISGSTVCPAGWIVPPNSGTKSYYNLFQYYTQNMATAEAAPLYFTRAGYYQDPSYITQDSFGYYWSSTEYNNSNAYFFVYSSNYFATQAYTGYKIDFYSIRCVFDS